MADTPYLDAYFNGDDYGDSVGGLATETNTGTGSTFGSIFGGIVALGAPLLQAWGQSQITRDVREQQAQVATAKSNTTLWIVGGIAAVVAIIAVIWVIKKR